MDEPTSSGERPSQGEADMVWPAHDSEDPSHSFLESERAKYPSQPQSSVLFTWKGFMEKTQWVFKYFFAPCAEKSQLAESPTPQHDMQDAEIDEEEILPIKHEAEESAPPSDYKAWQQKATYVSSAQVAMGRFRKSESEDGIENEEERFEECLTVTSDKADSENSNADQSMIVEEVDVVVFNTGKLESGVEFERFDESVSPDHLSAAEEDQTLEKHKDEMVPHAQHDSDFTLAPEQFEEIVKTEKRDAGSDTENNSGEEDLHDSDEEISTIMSQDMTHVTVVESDLTEAKESSSSSDESQDSVVKTVTFVSHESTDLVTSVNRDSGNEGITEGDSEEKDVVDEEIATRAKQEHGSESEGIDTNSEVSQPEIPTIAITEYDESSEQNLSTEHDDDTQIQEISEIEHTFTPPAVAITAADDSFEKTSESASTTDETRSKEDTRSAYSSSSLRRKKADTVEKVDRAVKRIFKRKIRSYVKQVTKSAGMPFLSEKFRDHGVVITPTVCRVNQSEKNTLSLKKAELSGSQSSLLGKLSSNRDEFVKLVALIGFEGYGKSMLMRRYADMATGRSVHVNELAETGIKRWHPFARKDIFKFVHFIDMRDIPTEGEYSPDELIFRILVKDITADEAAMGYKWLQEYKKSMLFIVDGVDDLDIFPEEVKVHIKDGGVASPQTIIYNLLMGNILPHAHVLTSSLVTNPSQLHDVMSPDKIYVLNGFDRHDIKAYLAKHTGVWKSLTEGGHYNLLSSSKVPLGLFYATNALVDDQYQLDSLFSSISQYVFDALKGKNQPVSADIFTKLKKLSHQCSARGGDVIEESELSSYGLSPADIENSQLFRERSVGRINADESLVWIKTFTFIHITIREHLSALYLGEAEMDEFSQFTKRHFGLTGYDFQQKSLYSLMFSYTNLEHAKDIVKVTHSDEKRVFLRQLLLERIESGPPSFYLYSIINESPDGIDDIVKEHCRTLSVVGSKLTSVSMFVLSSLAERVGSLDMLELNKCYPSEDTLARFLSSAKNTNVKIKVLSLRENPGILTAGGVIRDICRDCGVEELNLGGCGFHGDILAALPRILKDVALTVFKVDDNPEISEHSLHGVGEFVTKAGAKSLCLSNTDLNDTKLQRLKKSIAKYQLEHLDISRNRGIGLSDTAEIIGGIASECHIEVLKMSQCGITSKYWENFKDSLKSHRLRKLDISSSESITLSNDDISGLAELFPCITEELRIENWQISAEYFEMLTENLEKLGHPNVKIFYGSDGESVTKAVMSSDI